jgi:D5 N terminal like/Helix-turn-helix domain
VITLGEIVLIHDLKRQGLSVSAIARKLGMDRKTVRKHLEVGIASPAYRPRAAQPRLIEPYEEYLRARITAWPDLSGKRLLRELKERGYAGCYSVVTDFLREARSTIASGLSAGRKQPRSAPDGPRTRRRGAERSHLAEASGQDAAPVRVLDQQPALSAAASEPLLEDLVARHFTGRHAADMRFDADRGCWYLWTGDRWQPDATDLATDRMRALARDEAAGGSPRERAGAGRASFVAGAERLARTARPHVCRQEDWDPDPCRLGVPGSVRQAGVNSGMAI